jgi:hypothetical protein
LQSTNSSLICNWEASLALACTSASRNSYDRAVVLSNPIVTGQCPDKTVKIVKMVVDDTPGLFCVKSALEYDQDRLICNWEQNFAQACRSTAKYSILRQNISSGPNEFKRCPVTGQAVVKVDLR